MPQTTAGHGGIAGVIDRPRLYDLLDVREPRLCVVHGPSGAGKTTLLRSWALDRPVDHPLVWVSITAEAPSRLAFWENVATSARRAGLLSEDGARNLSMHMLAASDPLEAVLELLATAGPVTFVLDAYEHLRELTAQVDGDLLRLAAALPEVRVVVTTRGATTLTGAAYQLRGVVQLVDDHDLAFTVDEIRALLPERLARKEQLLAVSVSRETKGFALAVRALLLALEQRASVPAENTAEWRELVAQDLISQLPPDLAGTDPGSTLRLVLDTCVPPYFDIELAEQLTGHPRTADLVAELERSGFGRWIPYAPGHPVFQYVESMRDAFLSELMSDDPERASRDAVIAAGWLSGNEDHEQAIDLAIRGGDLELASRVFLAMVISDPDAYITDRLLLPLSRVPRRELAAHPLLAFATGLAMLPNVALRGEAGELFAIAAGAKRSPLIVSPELDRFVLAAMRAVSLRLSGSFRASALEAQRAISTLDEVPFAQHAMAREVVATLLRQLSYSLVQGGAFEQAYRVIERAADISASPASRNYAWVYVVGIRAFVGDLPGAAAVRRLVDPDAWPRGHERTYLNGLGLVGDALAELDDFRFENALQVLSNTEAYVQTAEFWPFIMLATVEARLGTSSLAVEVARVSSALAANPPAPGTGDNVGTAALVNALAVAWLAVGNPGRARDLLDRWSPDDPHVAPARVLRLLTSGLAQRAFEEHVRLVGLPGHTLRTRAALAVLGAAAAARTGAGSTALSLVARAAAVHESHGVRYHLLWVPREDRERLITVARAANDEAVVRYLDVDIPDVVPTQATVEELSDRETIVLRAMVVADNPGAIAEALFVSPNTIKSQQRSIYRKLGVSSRREALERATKLGILGS